MSFEAAMKAIDAGHCLDPTLVHGRPYELVYAEKCTSWLEKRCPEAGELLKLAVRSQHFRRFEVPRSSYPKTKAGYLAWRTFLKKRQGDMAAAICVEAGYSEEEGARVGSMIRKDNYKTDGETQVLEDVACLVFLESEFGAFSREHEESKVVRIVQKTWGKMSREGHALALGMEMDDACAAVVNSALSSP
ncbi:hypothetical protein BCR37DRAFT_394926 [Protomyces lactucae-debilis]|uniref:Glutamyl-tRNA synthetase n=1 Tax=Protomyces lactucae-debilis TaxID=2754530 RepID=A0A1Y2F0B7_PROLT|nr:uncharacterized protein BCR37DRAFT_394926 [Protomyces lactucae-debilis]ORY77289.1 hypothetical protein BCR37DRAFT_394926 [Protomyces lactucae-debilis]